MDALIYNLKLEPLTCPTCGATFAVAQALLDQRRRDGRRFCCPAGHRLYFPPNAAAGNPTEVRQLKRRLVRALHDAEQAEAHAQDLQRPHTEAEEHTAKAR